MIVHQGESGKGKSILGKWKIQGNPSCTSNFCLSVLTNTYARIFSFKQKKIISTDYKKTNYLKLQRIGVKKNKNLTSKYKPG